MMRKINKICNLSTNYLTWSATTKAVYGSVSSGNKQHYADALMQLLHCQNGLCAYTEQRIAPAHTYDIQHWDSGSYKIVAYEKFKEDGILNKPSLDHFDASLKKTKGWDWDNFLSVEGNANSKKLELAVDPRLKPDAPSYNFEDWFSYDVDTHRFRPKVGLSETDKKIVEDAIKVLGINSVCDDRRKCFAPHIEDVQLGIKTWAWILTRIEEYPTAAGFVSKVPIADDF
jgi:hypothetical protein